MPRRRRLKVTFDSSFWVHVVYLGLVDSLLHDYDLEVTREVEEELGTGSVSSEALRSSLASKRIRRGASSIRRVYLHGRGERAAINLALEKGLLLFIDDWRPAATARAASIETLSSVLYLVKLYGQGRRKADEVLDGLAFMARRNTLRRDYLISALRLVAEIRRRRGKERPGGRRR